MGKTVTKVIGRTQPKPRRFVGRYNMPDEAFWLTEDIQTLDLVLDLVAKLQDRSFVPANESDWQKGVWEAQKTLRRLKFILGSLQTIAENKLRYEFLAGQRIIKRPRKQTLGDIWEVLKASLDKDTGK